MTNILVHIGRVRALQVLTQAHIGSLIAWSGALVLLVVLLLSESSLVLSELLLLSAKIILMNRVDFLKASQLVTLYLYMA